MRPSVEPIPAGSGHTHAENASTGRGMLAEVYMRALDVVERHGVKLGPRCIACQHNTLTFPDASGAYHY